MSFATATARKISCSESSHNPCLHRTHSVYRVCAQAATDRLLVNVTPKTLIVFFLFLYVFNIFFCHCSLRLSACLVLWALLPEIKIDDDDDSLPVIVVGFYQELRILFIYG